MRNDPDALRGRWIKHKHGIWRFKADPIPPAPPKRYRNVTLCECGCLNQIGEDCPNCRLWAYRAEHRWNRQHAA